MDCRPGAPEEIGKYQEYFEASFQNRDESPMRGGELWTMKNLDNGNDDISCLSSDDLYSTEDDALSFFSTKIIMEEEFLVDGIEDDEYMYFEDEVVFNRIVASDSQGYNTVRRNYSPSQTLHNGCATFVSLETILATKDCSIFPPNENCISKTSKRYEYIQLLREAWRGR